MIDAPGYALSRAVLDVAMRIHTEIGPGLFERIYAVSLIDDLIAAGHAVQSEVAIAYVRNGRVMPAAYRLDLLVDDQLIVEIKAIDKLTTLHERQVQTYLRITGRPMGLLLNFNVLHLRHGFRRVLPIRR
ncbi:MAG: GxxExxY protein [Gemmatimonadaceae bacterium]|nr:GxxExxY protein [Gemmatimonadaceae bacterium]